MCFSINTRKTSFQILSIVSGSTSHCFVNLISKRCRNIWKKPKLIVSLLNYFIVLGSKSISRTISVSWCCFVSCHSYSHFCNFRLQAGNQGLMGTPLTFSYTHWLLYKPLLWHKDKIVTQLQWLTYIWHMRYYIVAFNSLNMLPLVIFSFVKTIASFSYCSPAPSTYSTNG